MTRTRYACRHSIDTKTTLTISDSPFQFNLPFQEFEFFFGPNSKSFKHKDSERKFESRGTGSGIIIRSDGYILTNNHVVDAKDIKVTLNDNRSFNGKIVGRDSFTDLALIKIPAKDLPCVALGSSNTVQAGDWAIAIGSPLGLDHTPLQQAKD